MKSAEIIALKINSLLKESRPIVIAIAGGPNLSRCVQYLDWHTTVTDDLSRRLLFISLNAASVPKSYGSSANVLAVRMAEIYHGSHIALTSSMSERVEKEYTWAKDNIDLVICGAGSRNGLLFRWYHSLGRFSLPPDAVGDMCLIPLKQSGDPVKLDKQGQKYLEEHLRPSPTWGKLRDLALSNKVIAVFGEAPPARPHSFGDEPDVTGNPTGQNDPVVEPPKTPIAVAALKGRLVGSCILGGGLAKAILEYPQQTE